jgi:hypothetical protein
MVVGSKCSSRLKQHCYKPAAEKLQFGDKPGFRNIPKLAAANRDLFFVLRRKSEGVGPNSLRF